MTIRMSMDTHRTLIKLVRKIQDKHKQNNEFRDKLFALDTEYATQRIELANEKNQQGCDQTITIEGIKVPLVGPEVDSITAYLAEMFVARQPIFPVLATKDNWDEAMAMQAIIDRDARLQSWGRQMLLFLARTVRHNTAALAFERAFFRSPVIKETDSVANATPRVEYEYVPNTTLKSLDMYNCIYDPRVPPADIPMRGEYAGYNEIISRSELKALGTALADRDMAYNLNKAYASTMNEKNKYYFEPPDVSDYISATQKNSGEVNWLDWVGIVTDENRNKPTLDADSYFKTTLYVRLIPNEVGLGKYKSPEVWKLIVINNEFVISVQKVVTPFDMIPIMFSDIREDGLGWQTKSPGEQMIPYEDMATELLNTRLQGSRRALADRALYDSDYLDPNQVNGKIPDAKIAIKKSLRNLGDRPGFNEIYYPIPFEGQGVINSMTDLNIVMQLKDQVNGQNFTSRGERQKGNRTAREFASIEATTQSKSLPYAIRLEEQVFGPGKLIIKSYVLLNQRAVNQKERVIDPYTNEEREINLVAMRSKMLDFKVTDGLHPKTSLQDPELLMTIMQTIGQNEAFAAEYELPKVLADILHVVNIDADKYRRKKDAIPATAAPAPEARPNPLATGGNTEGTPEAQ